jgi:nickel transport protein
MRQFRFLVLATAITGGVLLGTSAASAHDLRAKVTVADAVRVEAYFDGDMPAEFADVSVTDAAGAEVLVGKTDERGVWTFPLPKPGEYTLRVKSIDGHAARVVFRVEEAAETSPVVYAPWRMNKALALAIGLLLLLGLSAVSWFRGRRR